MKMGVGDGSVCICLLHPGLAFLIDSSILRQVQRTQKTQDSRLC